MCVCVCVVCECTVLANPTHTPVSKKLKTGGIKAGELCVVLANPTHTSVSNKLETGGVEVGALWAQRLCPSGLGAGHSGV